MEFNPASNNTISFPTGTGADTTGDEDRRVRIQEGAVNPFRDDFDGLPYTPVKTSLDLSTINYNNVQQIISSLQRHPGLTALNLSKRECVDDSVLLHIAQSYPDLIDLNVGLCLGVTDIGLEALTSHCSKLEKLEIGCCRDITREGLHFFVENCSAKLKHLRLLGLSVTDEQIETLVNRCPELTHLALSGGNFTSKGIAALTACTQLNHLEIKSCREIVNEDLRLLITSCPHIKHLNLNLSDTITSEFKETLRGEGIEVVDEYRR